MFSVIVHFSIQCFKFNRKLIYNNPLKEFKIYKISKKSLELRSGGLHDATFCDCTWPCVLCLGQGFIFQLNFNVSDFSNSTWMIGKFFELQVAQEILTAVRRCELPLQLDSLTEADGNCFCR